MAFSDPGTGRIIEQGDCDTIIGYMASATVAALEPGSRTDSTVT